MHIVFNQKVPSKSSFSSISDITVREKTDKTLNKLNLILVKHSKFQISIFFLYMLFLTVYTEEEVSTVRPVFISDRAAIYTTVLVGRENNCQCYLAFISST